MLAGGGEMPLTVARAARDQGRPVHVIAIEGAADKAIEAFPHSWVNVGAVGQILKIVKREGCSEIVIVGGMKRPRMSEVRLDLGALAHLPAVLRCFVGGDNSVLTGIVRFFERKGLRVLGAHDIVPDLVAENGTLGRCRPSRNDKEDIAIGLQVIAALGTLDIGQGAVVARRHVLAVEAAEGTDRMLERCRELNRRDEAGKDARRGVLVKGAKPRQERRVDLPTIGPETVRRAAAAGLAGIAVAASDVLIVQQKKCIADADSAGLFLVGVTITPGDGA